MWQVKSHFCVSLQQFVDSVCGNIHPPIFTQLHPTAHLIFNMLVLSNFYFHFQSAEKRFSLVCQKQISSIDIDALPGSSWGILALGLWSGQCQIFLKKTARHYKKWDREENCIIRTRACMGCRVTYRVSHTGCHMLDCLWVRDPLAGWGDWTAT